MMHPMRLGYLLPAGLLLLFMACGSDRTVQEEAVTPGSLSFSAIADQLAARMTLQPSERVLLVGLPGTFDSLVPLLQERIEAAGAEYLGAVSVGDTQPAGWATDFTRGMAGRDSARLVDYLSAVDLGIMLPGATPEDTTYAALQEVLRRGSGRTIHFHWSGAYDRNGAPLTVDAAIDAFYQRALLETDYAALAIDQHRFEEAMRDREIRVTTPAGTDIRFRIGDRPVTRQDGDASLARTSTARNLIDREVELPAGAIRVAPVETTVEGIIAFPDADWNGQPVKGLVMTFREGKLVGFGAKEGAPAVEAELAAAGEAGRSFREFALGFNPLLAIPADPPHWIPYYGYGAGVVRLSLGDNTELGGAVTGGYVRWNFFPDATVTVGGETWVKDGRMPGKK